MSPKKPTVKRQAKRQGAKLPALKPQPNGGALWAGPPANPVAGPGRPPNALRSLMRGNLEAVIPDLHAKWEAGAIDALDYANWLSRYTLDDRKDALPVAEAMRRVQATADLLRATLPAADYERLEPQLRAIWRGTP